MREKPILFSGPMVRAILDGAKTQTRRLVKLPPDFGLLRMATGGEAPRGSAVSYRVEPGGDEIDGTVIKPSAHVGDTLWVRETWCASSSLDGLSPGLMSESTPVAYLADGVTRGDWSVIAPGKTRVSIHMPRWASRLTLRVTDVRVERLGDISEADARAEGTVHAFAAAVREFRDAGVRGPDTTWHPLRCFPWLWCQVHGPDAWERDRERWVWVYGFEVCR